MSSGPSWRPADALPHITRNGLCRLPGASDVMAVLPTLAISRQNESTVMPESARGMPSLAAAYSATATSHLVVLAVGRDGCHRANLFIGTLPKVVIFSWSSRERPRLQFRRSGHITACPLGLRRVSLRGTPRSL